MILLEGNRELSFAEHIEELLSRTYVCLFSIILLSILSLPLTPYVVSAFKELVPKDVEVVVLSPFDNLIVLFELAFVCGIALSTPVVIYEALRFVVPALYPREKKILYTYIPLSIGLFSIGLSFAFKVVLPLMYDVCFAIFPGSAVKFFSLRSLIEQTLLLIVAFGLAFNTPLVMTLPVLLNFYDPSLYEENRAVAYTILAIIGVVFLTPRTTTVLDLVVVIVLIVLYELGVIMSKIMTKVVKG